jgi:hypothetical protein
VRTRLRTIVAAALPVAALATGAVSLDSRADASPSYTKIRAADEPLSAFVGQPAYEGNGVFLGTIHEIVVDNTAAGTPATAIVTRADGETLAMPLGPSEVVASLVTSRELMARVEQVTPVMIGLDFSPESRGS